MAYTVRTNGWYTNAPVGTAIQREDGAVRVKTTGNRWLLGGGQDGNAPFGRWKDVDLVPAIYALTDVLEREVWIPLPASTKKWAEEVWGPIYNGDYEVEGIELDLKHANFTPGIKSVVVPRLDYATPEDLEIDDY